MLLLYSVIQNICIKMINKVIFIYCVMLFTSVNTFAQTFQISPQNNLQKILDNSRDGDILELENGTYLGNFVIKKAITLMSKANNKVIIDAQGKGNALLLKSSNITVQNLTIINWGSDLTAQNAGIYSNKNNNIIIKNNKLHGDAFGMWLQKAKYIKVLNNTVVGNTKLRSADRGNGIQLSSVTHSRIYKNETYNVRDGLYVIASKNDIIEANQLHDLRYGIHYMYSYDNTVINNNAYNTRAGYALMSSKRLTIDGNKTTNSEDYGFLLNFITQSTFTNNQIKNVWVKPEHKVSGRDGKGLFVYNSGYNTIAYNRIEHAEIGIHLTAGSEKTKVYGNSFINNPTQVKYVVNREEEWSKDGKGNYWSNYLGWDMNNDSIGDVAFEPNDGIDKLVWQYPEMKMIMDSPAIIILRWVQRQFPVLKPPGVKDSFPLMHEPTLYKPKIVQARQHKDKQALANNHNLVHTNAPSAAEQH
ncbi:MAG: nitrous oxide reductase family maturation protein NosD [Alteromonadaceae bacterium]|nr:nitrous oxide reductase family maturation protein NosD [Alteromonadaceae bacterium]